MYKILICDDENYILEMLTDNINWKSLGAEVADTALNGQIGYNKFNTGHFDIILSDIRMPIMSGIEMAKKIRMQNKDVQIIFLTSYEEFEYAKSAIKINACGYILKPFDEKDLFDAVREAISRLEEKSHDSKIEAKEIAEKEVNDSNFIVDSINDYINENIRKKITLKDVSEHLGYSPNYIGQVYKKHTGMYVNEYIIKVKMENAKTLLKIPQNQVGTVAGMLGYSDQAYFIKQFKEFYGVTPKIYRDSIYRKQ